MKPFTSLLLRRPLRLFKRSVGASTRSGKILSGLLLILGLIGAGTLVRGQAVSTYAFAQGSGTYTNVTTGTVLFNEGDDIQDETPVAVTIPAFWYAGAYYTTMYVSSNGFITFGSAPSATEFDPLSSSAAYSGAISAFGADIEDASAGGSTEIRWANTGTEIVVQWRDFERNIFSNDEVFSFQIRLTLATGVIRTVYSTVTNVENSTSEQPQVGLRGASNAFPANVRNRLVNTTAGSTTWNTSINGTSASSTCRFTSGTVPASGQTYTFTPPCALPSQSNAGPDQPICTTGATATMAANTPAVGTGAWTLVSGTGTITTASSPTTTITGLSTSGPRTLRWTITNGSCVSSDDVVVTVNAAPSAATAGGDQNVCAATATMGGNTPAIGTGAWSFISGPATPGITTASSPTSGITGMTATGTYVFQWTISNAPCTSTTDQVSITRVPAPTTSNAGVDQGICIGDVATLAANIPGIGTGSWSIQTVANGATNSLAQFSSTTANDATFTPQTAGTYTLRWTIANSPCTSSTNDMVLVVSGMPTAANAGSDLATCASSGAVTMNGNNPSTGTGTWTKTSGGAATITTPTLRTTTITGLTVAGSPYTFRWTISNGTCPASFDEMDVVVNPNPVVTPSNDGPVCAGSPLTLTGSVDIASTTFAWAGPNGFTSTQQNPTIATSTVAATGVYWFSASAGGCASLEGQTVVTVSPQPTAVSVTPATPTICADGSVGLTAASTVANGQVVFHGAGMVVSASGANSAVPYPSQITVSGLPTSGVTVKSVTLRGITHSFPDDLDILLRFGTTNVMLMSDQGDDPDLNSITYTFDDAASTTLNGAAFNPSGTYDPSNSGTGDAIPSPGPGTLTYATAPLSSFTGNMNGTWNLFMRDDADADAGSITGWTIVFNVPSTLAYTWSPVADLSPTTGASVTASPSATGTYTATATATPGNCTATGTTLITVVPLPNAGSNNTLTTCSIDAPADMGALLGSHDAGSWSGPSTVISDMYDPATMDPGNYVYTVAAAPCSNATATITVTENTATPRYLDLDGDGFGDPNDSVLSCAPLPNRVSNNSDCNDSELHYADTDGDTFGAGAPIACGVANNLDDCPTVVGVVGSNCDANPSPFGFTLGQLNGSCACVAVPCTENLTIELRTNTNSDQASWEILDQNLNFVVCGGGGYPPGIVTPITDNCCLPVGCYRLRVLDSGGDGFVTGGYQLREGGVNGRRIIDNFENFTSGGTSAVSNTYDNGAFCIPIGDDRPIFSSCDKLDWVSNRFIVATENLDVTAEHGVTNTTSGYEFWFFDPNGTYSFRRFRNHATSDGFGSGATRACHFKINGWINSGLTPHIPANTLLNVRIRGRVAGNNEPFGPACLFKIDAVRAACPLVKLQDNPLNVSDFSCGVFKNFGGTNSASNRIVVNPAQFSPAAPSGQVRYQFRFRIPGEGICIVRPPQTSPTLHLNWHSGDLLECSKTYLVDVRVSKDGGATWCVDGPSPACDPGPVTPWGKICNVTINPCFQGGGEGNSLAVASSGNLTMYPNPNHGDQVFINLSNVATEVSTIAVDIYDMTGKRVDTHTIAVQDGMVNSSLDLHGDLNNGIYMVNITAGSNTYTERLVIQK